MFLPKDFMINLLFKLLICEFVAPVSLMSLTQERVDGFGACKYMIPSIECFKTDSKSTWGWGAEPSPHPFSVSVNEII